eukprot:TRINITY_DN25245_c0_g1_i1.p1 TRINITY_DN25245_c0_g1~~TRINITY_DN25245_c0_g1_i1.p1  ORF type:complete len:130 (+),score=28.31 TRINITY_DN25245_c0_g1_i1:33-422(+)
MVFVLDGRGCHHQVVLFFFCFFFSSRRRHTRSCLVSWARRCVQETERVVYKEQIQQDDGQIFPEFQGKIQQAKGILKQISFNNEQVEQLKSKYSKATTGEKEILRELDGIILEDTKLNNRLKDLSLIHI